MASYTVHAWVEKSGNRFVAVALQATEADDAVVKREQRRGLTERVANEDLLSMVQAMMRRITEHGGRVQRLSFRNPGPPLAAKADANREDSASAVS